jgi:hypothetical protein
MTLRDRLRKWWRPAQWEDDHPAERKQRSRPNAYDGQSGDRVQVTVQRDFKRSQRDFKKPR